MLSERAAEKLKKLLRDVGAVVPAKTSHVRKVRPDVPPGSSPSFHFALRIAEDESSQSGGLTATVGEGAVQVGGYTYFHEEESISLSSDASGYLCVKTDLTSGAVSCQLYESAEALKTAQDDMAHYVFPIYRIDDGRKSMDYRPLPNAGCWEVVA